MSNPFLIPGSPFNEVQRRQREHFKIGVYAALTTTAVFCFAMLIQGCRRELPKNDVAQADANPAPVVDAAASKPQASADVAAPAIQVAPPVNATADLSNPQQTAAMAPANVPQPVPAAAASASPSDSANAAPVVQPAPATAESNPARAPVESTYVIKAGDTLIRIARTHSTTVQALKAANGLRTDRIVVGKQLKIPLARKSSPSPLQS